VAAGAALLAGLAALPGCGNGGAAHDRTLVARPPEGPSGRSISVPADQPTVAAAVAAAGPGDLILLSPGTYREHVEIETPRLVLRGVDRNRVVFDGGSELEDGLVVRADGVVVENLTVRGYRGDGVVFTGRSATGTDAGRPLTHFRVSNVTAYANGGSGIVARRAEGGLIEASHASGHPQAGIAVEDCRPCTTTVTDSSAEANAVGFRASDAEGGLAIVESSWRSNRVGIVLRRRTATAADREEAAAPAVLVGGNVVLDNADPAAPAGEQGGFGTGIVVSGGVAAHVVRNRVSGHPGVGVAVTDAQRQAPRGIEVRENAMEANTTDLAFYLIAVAADEATGNCFTANDFATSTPVEIERRLACGRAAPAPAGERGERFPSPRLPPAPAAPAAVPPVPVAQPQLAVITAPGRPATTAPPPVDVATLSVPPAVS
jgi:hypothetical protein